MVDDSENENVELLTVGDFVRSTSRATLSAPRASGEVVALSKDGSKAEVLFGGLRCWLACTELSKVTPKKSLNKKLKNKKVSTLKRSKNIKKEIDLHGMRAVQAKEACLNFLSDAILAELDYVEIIHGLGSGRLQEVVHKILTESLVVKNFKLKEGNPGTTVVYF